MSSVARRRLGAAAPLVARVDVGAVAGVAACAGAAVLMLESMRVFASYLLFVVGQTERLQVGSIAFGTFAAIALAPALVRLTGVRRTVLLATAALVALRVGFQLWDDPAGRLWLAAGALAAWGWMAIGTAAASRSWLAAGLLVGLGADLGARIAGGTVDLAFMPSIASSTVTLAIALLTVAGAVVAPWPEAASQPGRVAVLPLVALGPALALFQLATGNLGFAEVRTGFDLPVAAAAPVAGLLAGAAVVAAGAGRSRFAMAVAAAGLALSVALMFQAGWPAWTGLAGASAATAVLVTGAVAGPLSTRPGTLALGLWISAGLLAQVGLLFVYYTLTGGTAVLVAAAAVVAAAGVIPETTPSVLGVRTALVVLSAVAAAPLLVTVTTWRLPTPTGALPADFTVVSYNIQSGFDRDSRWNLEATAEAIEAQQPDVVTLQEVSRGWVVAGGADEAVWLSRRLGMPLVFGSASGDGLWGNAVLARSPMTAVDMYRYRQTRNLSRQATAVRVTSAAGPLWVIVTHLDDPANGDAERLAQTSELLGFWNGKTPALIAGDFNADPGTAVPAAIERAGLFDSGATLPAGTGTSAEGRRIDYVFVTPDLAVRRVGVPDVGASDHRPLVAELSLTR